MLKRLFSKQSLPPVAKRSRFETRAPSHQNAVDIFAGRWASDLSPVLPGAISGDVPLFAETRPKAAAVGLGRNGRLDGMRVLELGPLEGGHSYALEKLGADVLAIESNADAYLKCLIAKEITGIKARFMLGDVTVVSKDNARTLRHDLCVRRPLSHVRSDDGHRGYLPRDRSLLCLVACVR